MADADEAMVWSSHEQVPASPQESTPSDAIAAAHAFGFTKNFMDPLPVREDAQVSTN
jgi:hypothetical protein